MSCRCRRYTGLIDAEASASKNSSSHSGQVALTAQNILERKKGHVGTPAFD